MTRKKLILLAIEEARKECGKIEKKEDAAVFGYAVEKILALSINNDGSVIFPPFFEHKNAVQWEADHILDRVQEKINN